MDLEKSLSQIEGDVEYNFHKKYDEENDIFYHNLQTCKYFEMNQFRTEFSTKTQNFSTYSHNVRSLNGHWDDILDILDSWAYRNTGQKDAQWTITMTGHHENFHEWFIGYASYSYNLALRYVDQTV